MTKTKTKTKCFKDRTYAYFWKAGHPRISNMTTRPDQTRRNHLDVTDLRWLAAFCWYWDGVVDSPKFHSLLPKLTLQLWSWAGIGRNLMRIPTIYIQQWCWWSNCFISKSFPLLGIVMFSHIMQVIGVWQLGPPFLPLVLHTWSDSFSSSSTFGAIYLLDRSELYHTLPS